MVIMPSYRNSEKNQGKKDYSRNFGRWAGVAARNIDRNKKYDSSLNWHKSMW